MSDSASGPQCQATDDHCITCGDEGIAMWVAATDGTTATCRDERGDSHQVAVDLVGPVVVGDPVLVHAGVAIGRADARPVKRDRRSSVLVRPRAGMARGGVQ